MKQYDLNYYSSSPSQSMTEDSNTLPPSETLLYENKKKSNKEIIISENKSNFNEEEKDFDFSSREKTFTTETRSIYRPQEETKEFKAAIFASEYKEQAKMNARSRSSSENSNASYEKSLIKPSMLTKLREKKEKKTWKQAEDQKIPEKKQKIPSIDAFISIEFLPHKDQKQDLFPLTVVSEKGLNIIRSKFFNLKNSLNIDDPQISFKHAEIICVNQNFLLADCESLNGTFVKVPVSRKLAIYKGLSFEIGDYEFLVEELEKGLQMKIKIKNLLKEEEFNDFVMKIKEINEIFIGNDLKRKNNDNYIYRDDQENMDFVTMEITTNDQDSYLSLISAKLTYTSSHNKKQFNRLKGMVENPQRSQFFARRIYGF